MSIELRDYQKQIIEAVNKTAERGIKRQLLVAVMGLGKTLTTTHIIDQKTNGGEKALILVDQKDLIDQWKKALHQTNPKLRVGVEQANNKAKLTDDVIIATVQTLGREGKKRIKKFPQDHFRYAFVDEADRSIAETWFRTLEYFNFGKDSFDQDNLLLGMTGTPYRSDGQSLGILYDDIVANYDLRFAISKGWLTDFKLYEVSTNTDLSKYSTQEELDQAVDNDERNAEALKAYRQFSDGEKALLYTASVEHAYRLCELFNEHDIPSAVIEANTPDDEREQILQDYRDGKIKCIHNFNTMSRGIDVPETTTLILLRKIQSKSLVFQIVGRVLRPSDTAFVNVFNTPEKRKKGIANSAKPYGKVIDLYDKVGNHNFAHVPSLFGLHNELKTNQPQKFYEEVVEPLEEKAKEHGFDKSKVKDLGDIDLIVKNRKVEISSLKLDPQIEQFTDRKWVSVGEDSYEIIYGEDNKVLMIEADQSKSELLDKKEWKLLEYDTKDGVTKELQTFNSLSGAFHTADRYADREGYDAKWKKRADWMKKGVTQNQAEKLKQLYTYKNGYSELRTLNDRYDNGVRKLLYKKTGEVLDRGSASELLQQKFSN